MRKIFVFGATSAIAQALGRLYAARGDALLLAARDPEKLRAVAEDMRSRGAGRVVTATADALDYARHESLVEQAHRSLGGLDLAILCHGALPDQKTCERDFETVRIGMETNALGTMSLLTHLANYFEKQKSGTLCVLSSPAGDRGRAANYVYGASKAAVTTFLQGLRSRLHESKVRVLTVKPGRVDTPMTADFAKGWLWSRPEDVAAGIYRAIEKKRDVVYVPGYWYFVMLAIRHVPEAVFKRMKV